MVLVVVVVAVVVVMIVGSEILHCCNNVFPWRWTPKTETCRMRGWKPDNKRFCVQCCYHRWILLHTLLFTVYFDYTQNYIYEFYLLQPNQIQPVLLPTSSDQSVMTLTYTHARRVPFEFGLGHRML